MQGKNYITIAKSLKKIADQKDKKQMPSQLPTYPQRNDLLKICSRTPLRALLNY